MMSIPTHSKNNAVILSQRGPHHNAVILSERGPRRTLQPGGGESKDLRLLLLLFLLLPLFLFLLLTALKGHDFSRADNANKITRALAPEGRL